MLLLYFFKCCILEKSGFQYESLYFRSCLNLTIKAKMHIVLGRKNIYELKYSI